MSHKPRRNMTIVVRVDPELHNQMQELANELGLTLSGLIYAEMKQLLRIRRLQVDGRLPSDLELRRLNTRDWRESVDWESIDRWD